MLVVLRYMKRDRELEVSKAFKQKHFIQRMTNRILFLIRSRLPATLQRMPFPDSPPTNPTDAPADRACGSADPLLPVGQAEVAAAIAYGLRFDERGKPRRGAAWEMAANLLAEQLVAQLERTNFVILKRPPGAPHST